MSPIAPSRQPDDRLRQILAHQGISRRFFSALPARRAERGGVAGLDLVVRLTSYRSLPLSCIAGIEIAIDGAPVDPAGLRLIVDGIDYTLAELGGLSGRWWFILDNALLFVPCARIESDLRVDGTLLTVEPYITAGRFTFRASDSRVVTLGEISV